LIYHPHWTRDLPSTRFLDHTRRHTTVDRTPPDEWSVRRKDLSLRKHKIHNRNTSIPPVGFELIISADERPWNYAVDRAATGRVPKFLPSKIVTDDYSHTHTHTYTHIYICYVYNFILSEHKKYILAIHFNVISFNFFNS
jgi:hypothetical protein